MSILGANDRYPLWQTVKEYGLIFPLVFIITLIATCLCRRLAVKLGIMDYPDGNVKPHIRPIAYLGGIGIWIGLIVGLVIGIWVLQRSGNGILKDPWTKKFMLGIGIGATLVCLVGLLDDIFNIKPWQKLLGQALAAGILIFAGIQLNLNTLFKGMDVT